MESFQIFIWKVYSRKFRLYRALYFERKRKSKMKWSFQKCVWICYTWNKCSMKNAIFFWRCLNTTVCEFNNFNIGPEMQFKRNLSSCTKWASKFRFYKRFCTKFILTSAFICPQFSVVFQQGKKAVNTYLILHMFLLLQETS